MGEGIGAGKKGPGGVREERNEGREKGRRIEVMEEVGREGWGQIIQ